MDRRTVSNRIVIYNLVILSGLAIFGLNYKISRDGQPPIRRAVGERICFVDLHALTRASALRPAAHALETKMFDRAFRLEGDSALQAQAPSSRDKRCTIYGIARCTNPRDGDLRVRLDRPSLIDNLFRSRSNRTQSDIRLELDSFVRGKWRALIPPEYHALYPDSAAHSPPNGEAGAERLKEIVLERLFGI
jgi:hypothetical protein